MRKLLAFAVAVPLPAYHSCLTMIPLRHVLFSFRGVIRVYELLRYTTSCPLEKEDRYSNGLKPFDLQVLPSSLLRTHPALTPRIIDTRSTVGRRQWSSGGLCSCISHTIMVLKGDKTLGIGSAKDYTVCCMLLWQVWVVNSVSASITAAEITLFKAKALEMIYVHGTGKARASVENKGNKWP